MIISASRRTDIPAFYSDWFINRLKDGYVLVKNPMNAKRVSKIKLIPDLVDCIVFWTKNPKPMIKNLDKIDSMGYKYYFQFTLTPYEEDIEMGLPLKENIIDTFKKLSERVGPERIIWRYDPIILNEKYSINFHLYEYEKMALKLEGYTKMCTISFVDMYAKVIKNARNIIKNEINRSDMRLIAEGFSKIAKEHGYVLSTCSEKIDLKEYGITHASCIDKDIIEKIIGCPIKASKDSNQRSECGCIESIDIGSYDSCTHGCIYCYANINKKLAAENNKRHDKNSVILIGHLNPDDIVTERKVKSFKIMQMSMFE